MPSSIHLLFQDARNHLIGFLGLSTTPAVGPQNCQFQQHLVSSERHALRSCSGPSWRAANLLHQTDLRVQVSGGTVSRIPWSYGFWNFESLSSHWAREIHCIDIMVEEKSGARRTFSGSLWAHAHALGHGATSGFGKHPRTQLSSSLVLKDYPVKFLD